MHFMSAALELVERGWSVFPLAPGSKIPLPGSRGLLEATSDPDQVRAWWLALPTANIGLALAPSGLFAIDADGADWRAKIATLESRLGPLPSTLIQLSGGGVGIHALFKAPPWPVRGQLDGVTLRGRNYLVVAPSVHPSGGLYRWHNPGASVAELPSAWQEAVRQRADVTGADVPDPAEEPPWLSALSAAERLVAARAHLEREPGEVMRQSRSGMTWDVCRSVTRGYAIRDAEAVFLALLEVYNPKCEPPWAESKLARMVETAYEKAALPEWGTYLRPRDAKSVLGFDPRGGATPPPAAPPPTSTELRACLQAAASRASRSTRAERKLEAAILRRVLTGKAPGEDDEDAGAALERAAVVVRANVPAGTTDAQLASTLARSAVGVLPDALIAVAVRAREIVDAPSPPSSADDFDIETIGPRAGQPANSSQRNVDVALRRLGVRPRYDQLGDVIVFERAGERTRITDDDVVTLLLEIDREFGFRVPKEFFFDVVGDRARADGFHPVCDYLDTLTWDGTPRIDTWLSTYAGATDDEYTRSVGALMLIAACRRARLPGAKFDEMLVLEAPQGTEKSSALRVLAVREEWFGDELPLGADSKRQIEAIAGRWIVEAGELSGLGKAEENDLKAFLSRQVDAARMAYARLTARFPRQCVIFGTTNETAYLKDPTGNRRWWPVRVEAFDVGALARDRDQLWAEASRREAEGASIRLPRHLWADAAREQDARRIDDTFVDLLDGPLRAKEGVIQTADVWRLLRIEPHEATEGQQRRLASAMRVLGWERSRLRFKGERASCYRKGESEQRITFQGMAGARAVS